MGDYAAASEYVGKLVAGWDGLAGIRRVAWGIWQMACLHLYADDAKQALSELADATALFRTDGLDQGIVSCFMSPRPTGCSVTVAGLMLRSTKANPFRDREAGAAPRFPPIRRLEPRSGSSQR